MDMVDTEDIHQPTIPTLMDRLMEPLLEAMVLVATVAIATMADGDQICRTAES